MDVVVYPEEISLTVTERDIRRGYIEYECPECDGTGVFEITETESQPCNYCKTRGTITASI